MKKVIVTQPVKASAEKIWEIVRTGDAVEKWFPIISSCNLKGSGIGAKRTCITADGNTLEETILNIDDKKMEFVLSIDKQEIMPVKNIVNKLKVADTIGGATIEWVAEFEMISETMYTEVERGLTDLYSMGIKGLEAAAMKN